MLLSLFLSFILSRRLGSKAYVVLMIVGIVLVSFFSTVGIGKAETYNSTYYFTPNFPIPLSFPFYALIDTTMIFIRPPDLPPLRGYCPIYFVTAEIGEFVFPLGSGLFLLIYSFFMLVNIIGVIIGYWISKSAALEILYKRARSPIQVLWS